MVLLMVSGARPHAAALGVWCVSAAAARSGSIRAKFREGDYDSSEGSPLSCCAIEPVRSSGALVHGQAGHMHNRGKELAMKREMHVGNRLQPDKECAPREFFNESALQGPESCCKSSNGRSGVKSLRTISTRLKSACRLLVRSRTIQCMRIV